MFLFDKSLNKQTNNELNKYWLLFPQAAPLALKPIDGFYHRALLLLQKINFTLTVVIYIKKLADFQQQQRKLIGLYFSLQLYWRYLCTALLYYTLKTLIIAQKCWTGLCFLYTICGKIVLHSKQQQPDTVNIWLNCIEYYFCCCSSFLLKRRPQPLCYV